MSVRPADVVAQAEKARVFSLRDAFAAPAPAPGTGTIGATGAAAAGGGNRLRLGPATVPLAHAPPPTARPVALSLKFSRPSQAPKGPTNLPSEVLRSLPVTNSITGKRAVPAAVPASPRPSAARAPAQAATSALAPTTATASVRKVYPASAESARADVMRLAAMVDDLQRKLNAAQTKAAAAERNAANTAQRAAVERNSLGSKLHGLQRELAVSKDCEEKAKIELRAVSNAKFEVDAAKTTLHEQQLASLEQTKASLLQTLSGMHKEHDGLKEQTKQLTARANREREVANSKSEAVKALEASAAERISKIRAAEDTERARLEELRKEVTAVEAEVQTLRTKSATNDVMETKGSPEAVAPPEEEAPGAPVPDPPPAVTPAWSAEERRRADAACSCCAYGVPTDLLGNVLAQVQETAGAPKPKSAPNSAPEQSPAQALACAVEKDLLENFKHNIVTHSGIPSRQDVAPMFPHTEDHQGNGGYEGVLEKERPSHCTDDKK